MACKALHAGLHLCSHPQFPPYPHRPLLQPHICSPKFLGFSTARNSTSPPSPAVLGTFGNVVVAGHNSGYHIDWELLLAASRWGQRWKITCSVWDSFSNRELSHSGLRVATLLKNRMALFHASVLCACRSLGLRCSSLTATWGASTD